MKFLLKNPITIWLRWAIFKIHNEWKFRNLSLKIGYLSNFRNCNFGRYNKIYDGVNLTNVSLGDFTYIAENTKISNAVLGKFCSIGNDAQIGLGKHPSRSFVSTHPAFFSILRQAPITFADQSYFEEYERISIGNDVWIGARAIVADGVVIGDGAIIATGAVVVNNVPDYAIVGGVPARLIRFRFSQEEVDFLQKFCWWDRSQKWFGDNFLLMHDIKKLIDNLDSDKPVENKKDDQ